MSAAKKPHAHRLARCPSMRGDLQCARRVHDDDRCGLAGIAWEKGSPRYPTLAGVRRDGRESLADLIDKHKPVFGRLQRNNPIVGCLCMDRLFIIDSDETWASHLAEVIVNA